MTIMFIGQMTDQPNPEVDLFPKESQIPTDYPPTGKPEAVPSPAPELKPQKREGNPFALLGIIFIIIIIVGGVIFISKGAHMSTSTTTANSTASSTFIQTTIPNTSTTSSASTTTINQSLAQQCSIARGPNPGFVGICNNATPEYVAMFTKSAVQSLSGNSSSSTYSPTNSFSSTSWFYLNKSYNNDSLNLSANKWYFMTTVLNYSNLSNESETVYVNGNKTLRASGHELISVLAFGFSANFKYISNFQYYNYSLGQRQIDTLYSKGIGGLPVNITNLVSWFPLNNDTKDYSGYNNKFTYSNFTFTKSFNYT